MKFVGQLSGKLGSDGDEFSKEWKKGAPENCRARQTIPVCQVPQKEP